MLPSDHPLRSSSFRRLSMAVLISSAGDWASVVAVAFGVLGFAGVVSFGLVLLAKEVAASLAVLVGGVIADRGERRVVLAWAWSIAGAAQMLTGADLLFIHSIPLAVGCQAMLGAGVAVGRPTSVALTPELVEKSQLAAANGVLGLTRNAVSLIGASVGAALVVGAGAGLAVILDGFSFVAACLLIRSIRASTGRNTMGESNGFLDDLRDGWGDFQSRRWVWGTVATFAVFQLSFFPAFNILGPAIIRARTGGAGAWAAIIAAGAIGAVFGGAAAATRKRPPRRPLVGVIGALLPSCLELALLGLNAPLEALIPVAAFAGGALALGDALWFSALQTSLPSAAIGRVSSFDWLGSIALSPIGYAVVPAIATSEGNRDTLLVAACAGALLCVASLARPEIYKHETVQATGPSRSSVIAA